MSLLFQTFRHLDSDKFVKLPKRDVFLVLYLWKVLELFSLLRMCRITQVVARNLFFFQERLYAEPQQGTLLYELRTAAKNLKTAVFSAHAGPVEETFKFYFSICAAVICCFAHVERRVKKG